MSYVQNLRNLTVHSLQRFISYYTSTFFILEIRGIYVKMTDIIWDSIIHLE